MELHLQAGLLLPESVLESAWFGVLSTFVAINTVMYVVLAISKTVPKVHVRDWLPRNYVRSQTRSIYPDADEGAGVRPTLGQNTGRGSVRVEREHPQAE